MPNCRGSPPPSRPLLSPGASRAVDWSVCDRQVVRSWCAAIGDAYQGSVATAVLWMLASFSSFYALIVTGIWMPLRTCQMRAHRSDDPARKHSASRFLSVTAYLSLIWHCFPAIWLANVLGLTTDMHFRLAFVVMDVLAKFLPPSLYLAVATTP